MKIYCLTKALLVSISIMLAMSLSSVWAINKCTDSAGKVNFSDLPCPENSVASKPTVKPSSGGHAIDDVVIANSAAASNGDIEGMKRTSVQGESFDKIPVGKQREQMIALLKYAAPVQVVIVSRNISVDGQSATVKATGKYRNMATELLEPTKGLVQLQRVNGSWKVLENSWSPDKW